jgi:hypothetical protein
MVKIYVMENTDWVGTFSECITQVADICDKVIWIKFYPSDIWEHPNKTPIRLWKILSSGYYLTVKKIAM